MGQTIKALLIEDDMSYAHRLTEVLSNANDCTFEVDWANTLPMALDGMSASAFEVVLLDLNLIDALHQNALEIFSKVIESADHTPVIVVGDNNNEAFVIEVFNHGAQAYLTKGDASNAMIVQLVTSSIERYYLLAEVNAQAKKLSESGCYKQMPRQYDSVSQSLFSANMIGSSLPHLWWRNPHEAQQGMIMLQHIAEDILNTINGLLEKCPAS